MAVKLAVMGCEEHHPCNHMVRLISQLVNGLGQFKLFTYSLWCRPLSREILSSSMEEEWIYSTSIESPWIFLKKWKRKREKEKLKVEIDSWSMMQLILHWGWKNLSHLANMGHSVEIGLHVLDRPPGSCGSILNEDISGVSLPRRILALNLPRRILVS